MKKFLLQIVFLACIVPVLVPAHAIQQSNPSLLSQTVNISPGQFNKIQDDKNIISFENTHAGAWQITIQNNLLYSNPKGNAIVRIYDAKIDGKFIEIGMGSPPERKFWVALNFPDVGYLTATRIDKEGWFANSKVIAAYSDSEGVTINNGQRIVVSGVELKEFVIGKYEVYGMDEPTDPPAINSGTFSMDVLSGDVSKNPLHYYPFYVAGGVGVVIVILLITKKRSS